MKENKDLIIETIDLTRIYGDGVGVRALDGVNLKISKGEFVSVMGPSGSGKSTLLNLLGALDLPTSGKVIIAGTDMEKMKDKDTFRAKTVGFVFQLHNLLPTLTSLENVEIPMMGFLTASGRRKRALELLELVGMTDRLHHQPGQLSGGQRQRVAVARALANNPLLVLADEPTGNLDTVNGQDLMKLMRELNTTQGTTFVVVTHDSSVATQTQRIVGMEDGRIVRDEVLGSALEEDLKSWRRSLLGQRILKDDPAVLGIGINRQQAKTLRSLFQQPTTEVSDD